MKKKVLLSSLMTIVLCVCLITGSTFALFTSTSEVNIAVTAGKVEMLASVEDFKIYSVEAKADGPIQDENLNRYDYVERDVDPLTKIGVFANGGTAQLDSSLITLDRITPGDKISFGIDGANNSDVTIQCRYIIQCAGDEALMKGLIVYIDGVPYPALKSYTSAWTTLEVGKSITDTKNIEVEVELPVTAGNEYQEKTTKINVLVEAVQGNAVVDTNPAVAQFLNTTINLETTTIAGTVVNDENGDVDLVGGLIDVDEVGFENYGEATLTDTVLNAGTPGTQAYGYAFISQAGSTSVLDNVTVKSANGAIAASDGAELTFNGGYVEVDSQSTSGRYLFYVVGQGTVATINDGEFYFNKTQNQKRAYAYVGDGATLYIKGGNFGTASSRSGYTAGLLGDGDIIITGGTFGFNPSAWVAPGYQATKVGSTWVVLPENVAVITTADQLAAALKGTDKEINVKLFNDIDIPMSALGSQTPGSGEYKIGGDTTESIVIDLNGKTLTLTTSYMTALGAKNDNATITIKNGNMNGTGNSATTWNINDLIFANCNYVFENVTFEKEVALSNTGKNVEMTDVTINGTGDYYALWIQAEGQNVTIDGLTINTPGRGIKIDEQYSNANVAKVTLSVTDADFNTQKKAAIMVKSVKGADITLNNVDIADTADATNAVWVDEDAKTYADLVTVVGAKVIVEGE